MSKKGIPALPSDVPWRGTSGAKRVPKIHHSPILCLPETPLSDYALSVMKHHDPIGSGLGKGAILEAAGPDCLVPGQMTPVKLFGIKVWPIEIDLKFMEPIGKQLKFIGRVLDSTTDLMDKAFIDR